MVRHPELQGFQADSVIARLPDSVQVFVVGGAVRDALLKRHSSDRDWVVVGATVDSMLAAGFTPVGADFPVFLHPITKEEYALARTERKSGHGYKGFTFHANPTVSLAEDLARRDFTVNAMAMSSAGELIDPYGGFTDLQHRVMRHVSPAFVEDPLRVLRLARFLARFLDFTVVDETIALCNTLRESGELTHLVAERIFAELNKGMEEEKPSRMIKLLTKLDAWFELGGSRALLFARLEDSRLKTVDQLGTAFDRWVYQLAQLAEKNEVKQLADHWRIPKEIQQAAIVFVELEKFWQNAKFDAADFGDLFDRVDLYRRPERLEDVHRLFKQAKGSKAEFRLVDLAVEQVRSGVYKKFIANAIQQAGPDVVVAQVVTEARRFWLDLIHAAY
ncbi:CCA tRNA nucleotidyltransferase [Limnobacter sp.]|uniref:CCA tRNA nucleotidyltransferase n=1 Tax=Limnobacter sp. TaxID=2003368 RepID=UPI002FE10A74